MSGFMNNRRSSYNGFFFWFSKKKVSFFFNNVSKCPPSLITIVQGVIVVRELEVMTSLSDYVENGNGSIERVRETTVTFWKELGWNKRCSILYQPGIGVIYIIKWIYLCYLSDIVEVPLQTYISRLRKPLREAEPLSAHHLRV